MPDRAAPGWSDADLLVLLTGALVPDDVQPTEAGLAGLRASLEARRTWPAAPATALTPTKRSTTWAGPFRRGLVALGLIAGISVSGTGVALAAGATLPEPVRVIAHHLGLPLRSPAPRPVRVSGPTGLGPDRAGATSSRPAANVRAQSGSGTPPAPGAGPQRWRAGPAPSRIVSGPGPVDSRAGGSAGGYRLARPNDTGRHPLPGGPATQPSNSSKSDARSVVDRPPGAQPNPSRPGTGGDPQGSRGPAAAAWVGGERATQTAGGGLD